MICFNHPVVSNIACVYRLLFSDGTFYIGSTGNMKGRVTVYRYEFKNPRRFSFKVYMAALNNDSVIFEILEVVSKDNNKHIEDTYIKNNWGSSLLLNTSSSAFRMVGKSGKLKMINPKKKVGKFNERKKRVFQYTKTGNYITEHESCSAAAVSIGTSSGNVVKVLKGKRKTTMGFVFKYAS